MKNLFNMILNYISLSVKGIIKEIIPSDELLEVLKAYKFKYIVNGNHIKDIQPTVATFYLLSTKLQILLFLAVFANMETVTVQDFTRFKNFLKASQNRNYLKGKPISNFSYRLGLR